MGMRCRCRHYIFGREVPECPVDIEQAHFKEHHIHMNNPHHFPVSPCFAQIPNLSHGPEVHVLLGASLARCNYRCRLSQAVGFVRTHTLRLTTWTPPFFTHQIYSAAPSLELYDPAVAGVFNQRLQPGARLCKKPVILVCVAPDEMSADSLCTSA